MMCGSDWSDYGAVVDREKKYGSHPRAMGTMARRLELIRDNGLWTLEDAVYRLTRYAVRGLRTAHDREAERGAQRRYYGL